MSGSLIGIMPERRTREPAPRINWDRLGPTLRPLSANRKIGKVANDAVRRPRFVYELLMLSMSIDARAANGYSD